MARCSDNRCHAPKIACHRGEVTPEECSAWRKSNHTGTEAAEDEKSSHSLLPWSGSALGLTDLDFVTARGDPNLVALLGAHNAGKTTLLGACYLLLGRTGKLGGSRFAGSYSLEGWEAIAHALRWEGTPPSFPPHTSARSGRAPGLLHFALRDGSKQLRDIFFADAPGEWFQRWSVESEAPDAAGARWLAENATTLAIVADCELLAGADRGIARSNTIQLLRRTSAVCGDRPVALVWSKSDIEISEGIREAIRDAALTAIPNIVEFGVSVVDHTSEGQPAEAITSLQQFFEWAVAPLPLGLSSTEGPVAATEPFFAMGNR